MCSFKQNDTYEKSEYNQLSLHFFISGIYSGYRNVVNLVKNVLPNPFNYTKMFHKKDIVEKRSRKSFHFNI